MKVHRNTLLLLACLVWSAVGFNILHIGVLAYAGCLSAVNILLSALVFTVFQLFSASSSSGYRKNYLLREGTTPFSQFFDGKPLTPVKAKATPRKNTVLR